MSTQVAKVESSNLNGVYKVYYRDDTTYDVFREWHDNGKHRKKIETSGSLTGALALIIDLENNALLTARKSYTGKHYIGEIVHHGYHECVVTEVWNVDGKNGISIKPSGRYGFEIDIYDEQL